MRHEMKLAARAARRQRQKELADGVRTCRLGRVKYEEPSVNLKLSGEQVNSLRRLAVEFGEIATVLRFECLSDDVIPSLHRYRWSGDRNVIQPIKSVQSPKCLLWKTSGETWSDLWKNRLVKQKCGGGGG